MAKIKASFFGPIRRPWPEQSRELEIQAGSTILNLLEELGYSEDDMRRVATVVNGKRRPLKDELIDGDDLRLVLLAGGG